MDNNLGNTAVKQETEFAKKKEVKLEKKIKGSLVPQRGHTLFEFDVETGEIRRTKFDRELKIDFSEITKTNTINKKVLIKDKHLYISVLNTKNVKKVLLREYGIDYNKYKANCDAGLRGDGAKKESA